MALAQGESPVRTCALSKTNRIVDAFQRANNLTLSRDLIPQVKKVAFIQHLIPTRRIEINIIFDSYVYRF